jgi:hypothetical protein
VADSNSMRDISSELLGLKNNVTFLSAKQVHHRYKMAYSTFQRHLRMLALSGKHPDAFRFSESLSSITGEGREYYRIEIHPLRGIEVLDRHFGYIERYGVRRGV